MRANLFSPFLRSSTLLSSLLLLSACSESVSDSVGNNNFITFSAVVDKGWEATRSADKEIFQETEPIRLHCLEVLGLIHNNASRPLYLHTTVEPIIENTRGTMINSAGELDKTVGFSVTGYRYPSMGNATDANFLYNAQVKNIEGKWKSTQPYYKPTINDKIDFYAFYPYGNAHTTVANQTDNAPLTLDFKVDTVNIYQQTDLLTAVKKEQVFDDTEVIDLTFTHALTAVRFIVGDNIVEGSLKSVSLEDIYFEGKHTIGKATWDFTNKTLSGNKLKLSFTEPGIDTYTYTDTLNKGTLTWLMIPQKFTDSHSKIVIRMDLGDGKGVKAYEAKLQGTEWKPGTIVTYAINTSALNVIRMNSVNYPSSWGGATFSLRNSYLSGDSVGVYVVDTVAKKVVEANVKYTYNGTKWSTSFGDTIHYKPSYVFYCYAPYRSVMNNAPIKNATYDASNKTAEQFFANVINNWTVPSDQSSESTFLSCDLQVAKYKGRPNMQFGMEHQMGLIEIKLATSKFLGTVQYKPASTSTGSTYTRANQPVYVTATEKLDNFPYKPYYNYITDYCSFITKGDHSYTIKSISNAYNKWTEDIATSVSNKIGHRYTVYPDCSENETYQGIFYTCISDIQTFTVPENGYYTMEVWGGTGGYGKHGNYTGNGGKGGYSIGASKHLSNERLYVVVGGAGTNATTSQTRYSGGYNGGGNSYTIRTDGKWGAGGGATHISRVTGILAELSSQKESIIIVAGAGGGGAAQNTKKSNGGAGGGVSGIKGGYTTSGTMSMGGYGGTQTGGGIGYAYLSNKTYGSCNGGFGYGGNFNNNTNLGIAGGGAGYYGGGAGYQSTSAAGGGSGYVGTLLDGKTIAGNASFPTTTASGTETGHSGDGYARITIPIPVR